MVLEIIQFISDFGNPCDIDYLRYWQGAEKSQSPLHHPRSKGLTPKGQSDSN